MGEMIVSRAKLVHEVCAKEDTGCQYLSFCDEQRLRHVCCIFVRISLNLFRQSLSGAEAHPLPLACQVTPLNFPQPVMRGAESCLALHQMQVLEETRMPRQVGMHLGTEVHAEGLQKGSNIWRGPLLPKSICKTDVSDGHTTQQRSIGRGSVPSNPEGTLLWG